MSSQQSSGECRRGEESRGQERCETLEMYREVLRCPQPQRLLSSFVPEACLDSAHSPICPGAEEIVKLPAHMELKQQTAPANRNDNSKLKVIIIIIIYTAPFTIEFSCVALLTLARSTLELQGQGKTLLW